MLNPGLNLGKAIRNGMTRGQEVYGTHGVGVKSVDIMGNTKSEGSTLALSDTETRKRG
jgi:hypothetical protein